MCHWIIRAVVYLLIPTSNHNERLVDYLKRYVVYLLIPTSNHNVGISKSEHSELFISWFLHQTTTVRNHYLCSVLLFISWFLHQTTTTLCKWDDYFSCLSLDSYIKPQLMSCLLLWEEVVYLLIPTSNHNSICVRNTFTKLFISWFLHQTTTPNFRSLEWWGCLSLDSYIKPQPDHLKKQATGVVYLLIPTSNHNW